MTTYIHGNNVCHGRKRCQPSANLSEEACAFKGFGLFTQLAICAYNNDSLSLSLPSCFFLVCSITKERYGDTYMS